MNHLLFVQKNYSETKHLLKYALFALAIVYLFCFCLHLFLYTPEYTHGQIIVLSTLGYSLRTIANKLRISKCAVQNSNKSIEGILLQFPHVLNVAESASHRQEMIGERCRKRLQVEAYQI